MPSTKRNPHRTRLTVAPLEDRVVPAGLDFYQPPSQMLWNPDGFLSPPVAGDPLDVALEFLRGTAGSLGLTPADLTAPVVTGQYTDTGTGITHLYLTQTLNGLEVVNAVLNLSLTRWNQVITVGSSFIGDLADSITPATVTGSPVFSAADALTQAVGTFGLTVTTSPAMVSGTGSGSSVMLSAPELSADAIPATPVYVATPTGVHHAWDYVFRTPDGAHWYNLQVDANTGQALNVADWGGSAAAAYTVYPLPTQSPDDAPRTVLADPSDPLASPFGWHDTNGIAGAETTDTTGNNVIAQEDHDGNNGTGARADGGPGLHFDFPIDLNQPPSTYTNASLTNLFYLTNTAHDLFYHYGFTEAAGNFQTMNYTGNGFGNDAVLADGQDGSETNNADFATPPDGQAPRMQIYLWDAYAPNRVIPNTPGVAEPGAVARSTFGPQTYSVTADATVTVPARADSPITNTIAGKIAVIDRGGTVEFADRVQNAQNAGAVGVIIVNNVPGPPFVFTGSNAAITIPAVMISQADGTALKAAIQNGTVNLTLTGTYLGQRDGSFDAGIIIHEYGHGVSNRLTGGPANANALIATQSNGMGEGWSDFFALMFTQKPGDTASDPRAIAAYSTGNPNGIRRQPYSFDQTIDPITFQAYNADLEQESHRTGEIWASALWDLNWLLIGKYGYDSDLSTGFTGSGAGAAGNKLALQLVLDGLKLQPANPSFIEARNAILAADFALTGGQNQQEIWTAFARRGLGVAASTTGANSTSVTLSFLVPSVLPRVTNSTAATLQGGTFVVKFSQEMDPNSFNLATGIASFTDTGGADRRAALTGFTWNTNHTELTFTLDVAANAGSYTLILSPTIADSQGRLLDQNSNSTGGEDPDDQATVTITVFQPLIVTTLTDELDPVYDPNDLSLREAIDLANQSTDSGMIQFAPALAGGTINLTLGGLTVTSTLTIHGPAASILISGINQYQVLTVASSASLDLANVTLTRGKAVSGANLLNFGNLTATRINLSNGNSIDDSGGGLFNAGTAIFNGVTVSGNSGGGIVNSGSLALTNVTVSGNRAEFSGGGIANGGALTATNVTITANHSDGANEGSNIGGGLYIFGGSTVLNNSIVAGNFRGDGTTTPDDIGTDPGKTVTLITSFSNLIGTGGSGGLVDGVNGNIVGVADARLGPLQNNGGTTKTHLPRPDSPALDSADPGKAPATDQRGTARPAGTGPDIGATEAVFQLTGLVDHAIDEDTTLTQDFDIHDYPQDATFTFTSSNPSLVATSGITVSGTGSNRILTVVPVANAFGTATITVAIGDGNTIWDSETFELTVHPVNDAPILTGIGRLMSIPMNTINPVGAPLAAVFASAGFTDLDPGNTLTGFAIVGNSANSVTEGIWEYSTDGNHWFDISPVTDTGTALALSLSTQIRFRPVAGFSGSVGPLIVRALDSTYSGGFSSTSGGVETRVSLDSRLNGTPYAMAVDTNSILTFVEAPPPVSPPSIVPPVPPIRPAAIAFASGTGAGGDGKVTVFRTNGSSAYSLMPFPEAPNAAVRVATADVNADGNPDLIVTTGVGVPVKVTLFDGITRKAIRGLTPFETTFTGGAFVSAMDLDGDGFAEVVVSPDESGGPRVVVFSGRTGEKLADFFGIDDPNFRGGVRTALGDLNRDGIPELIVAAGFGGGPRIAVWDGRTLRPGSLPQRLVNDFFLFEESLRNGAYIASGDINGDGFADLVGGGGPSGGPRVYAVDGQQLLASGGTELVPLANFFAGDPTNRNGVRVATAHLANDRRSDLVVATDGATGPSVFGYLSANLTSTDVPVPEFGPNRFPDLLGGVFVG